MHLAGSSTPRLICCALWTVAVAVAAMTTSTEQATPTNHDATGGGIAARLARSNILALEPYRCARDDYSSGILLDANENAYGPPIERNDADDDCVLERYPDPYQIPLKEKLAAYRGHNLQPQNIFVGVGSDEAIDLLMRIFCRPGIDKILQTPPTYGMYKVCAKVNDVEVVNVPLTPDFDLRIPEVRLGCPGVLQTCISQDHWHSETYLVILYLRFWFLKILDAITPEVKLLFLCSPGNPTSKALSLQDMERVISSPQAQNLLVVVDEAYVDFSTKGSALSLLHTYPNLVVLQTLSKAFGLAAIRCGFCLGAPDVIQLMNNVKAPYNVNSLTSQLALQTFEHVDRLHTNVATLLQQRNVVANALQGLDFVTRVYESDANFLLFRLASKAKQVYKTMADQGVVTRFRGTEIHCHECIRVTIGTPDENAAFLEALVKTYHQS